MSGDLSRVRHHLEAAIAALNLDDELDRLVNPRHTDHDRHAYLPKRVADAIAPDFICRNSVKELLEVLSGPATKSAQSPAH